MINGNYSIKVEILVSGLTRPGIDVNGKVHCYRIWKFIYYRAPRHITSSHTIMILTTVIALIKATTARSLRGLEHTVNSSVAEV